MQLVSRNKAQPSDCHCRLKRNPILIWKSELLQNEVTCPTRTSRSTPTRVRAYARALFPVYWPSRNKYVLKSVPSVYNTAGAVIYLWWFLLRVSPRRRSLHRVDCLALQPRWPLGRLRALQHTFACFYPLYYESGQGLK